MHRTASLNEISGRYSVLENEFYVPDPEVIRMQSTRNKQGGDEDFDVDQQFAKEVIDKLEAEQQAAYADYEGRIAQNVSRELARINHPLSIYTQWYWKMDLHNLFHFLGLRMEKHAQMEMRQYANAIYQLIEPIVPLACEAFRDYRLEGCFLSRMEMDAIRKFILEEDPTEADLEAAGMTKREIEGLKEKLSV